MTAETGENFTFTSTLTFSGIAESLQIPALKHRAIIDSGTSLHFCPDHMKFVNYHTLKGQKICTANREVLMAQGIGNVHIKMPNKNTKTKFTLENAIYAPEMAFTLISVSHLDTVNCSTLFKGGQCIIMNPKGTTMATLPLSDGLYHLIN